jgi:DNA-binding transcriptional ArsR family regulator
VTGEHPQVYVGGVLGFKRSRTTPATSAAVGNVGGLRPPGVETEERCCARNTAAEIGKAIAHPLRTDILTVLHDGPECASGLAKQTGVTLGTIGHHIKELKAANAIEVAFNRPKGSHNVVYYRPLTTSVFLAEDLAKLSREQQHELNRVIVQSIAAEALAALGAGHLAGDPLASAAWDRVSLDHTGYEELSASCLDFLQRLYAISAVADERMRVTGEHPQVYVGGVLGFKRSRTTPATSAAVGSLADIPVLE